MPHLPVALNEKEIASIYHFYDEAWSVLRIREALLQLRQDQDANNRVLPKVMNGLEALSIDHGFANKASRLLEELQGKLDEISLIGNPISQS